MTGVTEDVQLPYKVVGMDKEVYAGFKISLELLLDLKMPITLMTEGMADVLVTVSLQVMNQILTFVPGTCTSRQITTRYYHYDDSQNLRDAFDAVITPVPRSVTLRVIVSAA